MKNSRIFVAVIYVVAVCLLIALVFSSHSYAYNKFDKEYKMIHFELAGEFKITGYDICVSCCGNTNGITSSGTKATVGRTCASNYFTPGTELYIVGLGYRIVEDTGGMKDNVIDILCNNHPECYAITGNYRVYVVDRNYTGKDAIK